MPQILLDQRHFLFLKVRPKLSAAKDHVWPCSLFSKDEVVEDVLAKLYCAGIFYLLQELDDSQNGESVELKALRRELVDRLI